MSSLYNISNIKKSENPLEIQFDIRATNDPSQEIPTDSLFYFTVIGDLYYERKTKAYGYGTSAFSENKSETFSINESTILDWYVDCLNKFFSANDYSKKLYENCNFINEFRSSLKINVLSINNNENEIANTTILLTSVDSTLLNNFFGINEIDLSFDNSYLI